MIVRNARRLERLSSDILQIARMESQSLTLCKEQFNLDDVVSDVIRNAWDELNGSNVQLRYLPANISIYADKMKIAQVVQNLLSNAIKFTVHGSISIRAEEKDGQAIVTIKDTGKGIDPDIICQKLFSKFATKSEKGTGLGLYISQRIVEAMGAGYGQRTTMDKARRLHLAFQVINSFNQAEWRPAGIKELICCWNAGKARVCVKFTFLWWLEPLRADVCSRHGLRTGNKH